MRERSFSTSSINLATSPLQISVHQLGKYSLHHFLVQPSTHLGLEMFTLNKIPRLKLSFTEKSYCHT